MQAVEAGSAVGGSWGCRWWRLGAQWVEAGGAGDGGGGAGRGWEHRQWRLGAQGVEAGGSGGGGWGCRGWRLAFTVTQMQGRWLDWQPYSQEHIVKFSLILQVGC